MLKPPTSLGEALTCQIITKPVMRSEKLADFFGS